MPLCKATAPRSHDAYLASLTRATRAKLRAAVRASAHHCTFFPGAHPIAANAERLASYATSKGTVRFPKGEPLPSALVKARLAEFALKKTRPAALSRRRTKP